MVKHSPKILASEEKATIVQSTPHIYQLQDGTATGRNQPLFTWKGNNRIDVIVP